MNFKIWKVIVDRREDFGIDSRSMVKPDGKCDVVFEDGRTERRVVRLHLDHPGFFTVDGVVGRHPISLIREKT